MNPNKLIFKFAKKKKRNFNLRNTQNEFLLIEVTTQEVIDKVVGYQYIGSSNGYLVILNGEKNEDKYLLIYKIEKEMVCCNQYFNNPKKLKFYFN